MWKTVKIRSSDKELNDLLSVKIHNFDFKMQAAQFQLLSEYIHWCLMLYWASCVCFDNPDLCIQIYILKIKIAIIFFAKNVTGLGFLMHLDNLFQDTSLISSI